MFPKAYLQYLIHFHIDRDYFECHEVLEEYWKEKQQQDIIWVGLIQIAVSLYHQRRANYQGASKMMSSAITILDDNEHKLQELGIKSDLLLHLLRVRLQEIKQEKRYTSFDLPLTEETVAQCRTYCESNQLQWCSNKNIEDQYLINKHSLRDRTDVIHEREQSIKRRKTR